MGVPTRPSTGTPASPSPTATAFPTEAFAAITEDPVPAELAAELQSILVADHLPADLDFDTNGATIRHLIPADERDAGIQLETDVLPFDDSSVTQIWAPDGESVLAAILETGETSNSRLVQWDPVTTQPMTWNPSVEPAWQRLPP